VPSRLPALAVELVLGQLRIVSANGPEVPRAKPVAMAAIRVTAPGRAGCSTGCRPMTFLVRKALMLRRVKLLEFFAALLTVSGAVSPRPGIRRLARRPGCGVCSPRPCRSLSGQAYCPKGGLGWTGSGAGQPSIGWDAPLEFALELWLALRNLSQESCVRIVISGYTRL
jgi:hypothetical protein